MKKILYALLTLGILVWAKPASATTTTLSMPSIGDFIGYLLDTIGPLLTAFWPLLAIFAGFGIFAWAVHHFTRVGR